MIVRMRVTTSNSTERHKLPRPAYVLILNWPVQSLGGVNEVVLNLAQQIRALSSYDTVIAVASWENASGESTYVRGNEVINITLKTPLASTRGVRTFLGFLASLPSDILKLAAFIRERQVEVINAHFPGLNLYIFLLLKVVRLFRGKLILSFHGGDMISVYKAQGIIHRTAWRTLITKADGVVVPSDALREKVLGFAPVANVVTIHNGVDVSLFNRPRINRSKRLTVLHIGVFDHIRKSQDVLLQAFQLLLKRIPDASLILIGLQGPDLMQTQALISALDLEGRVEIHLDVSHDQLPQFMDRADLFVLPSRTEGFGIVLLEAGAAGLPVIATRVGGIPELIEDGINGLLVPPENFVELQSAMYDLLTDIAKADRLAQAWHERVVMTWDWERTSRQYLRALVENFGDT